MTTGTQFNPPTTNSFLLNMAPKTAESASTAGRFGNDVETAKFKHGVVVVIRKCVSATEVQPISWTVREGDRVARVRSFRANVRRDQRPEGSPSFKGVY